jgi:hypothetical protein
MKRLILLALVAGLPARFLVAQSCSTCPSLDFPDTAVTVTLQSTGWTPAFAGFGQYRGALAPAGGPLPSVFAPGAYAAWVLSAPGVPISDGIYTATVTAPVAAPLWNQILYVLNHKSGTSTDVQNAIGALLGSVTVPSLNAAAKLNALAMYNDAIAYGAAYVPPPGGRAAIALRNPVSGSPHLIVETAQCGSAVGRVSRDSGGGLNGVVVQLLDGAGNYLAGTTTAPSPADDPVQPAGTNGFYRFSGYCPGSYQVKVDPAQTILGGARLVSASPRAIAWPVGGEVATDFSFTAGAPPLRLSCPQTWSQPGFPYTAALPITGGVEPYAVTYTGALPPGVSMDAAGNLSGTVASGAAPGSYKFTALVSAAGASPASISCSISISKPLGVGCPGASAEENQPYSGALPPAGGSGQYTFGVTTPDAFPAGLTVDRLSGRISGTPAAHGSFAFTAGVDDRVGLADGPRTAGCSLTVAPPPAPLTAGALTANAVKNLAYDSTVPVSGGAAPYHYSLTGAVPPGLSFDAASGRVSGTPTQEGAWSFNVQVQDSASATVTAASNITVSRPFTISCPRAVGYAGLAYLSPIGVTGGTGPFSITAAGLPAGLALDGANLGGSPSAPGSASVTLRVADNATGAWDTAACRIDVYSQPSIACPAAAGLPGTAYASTLTATGGTGRYTFTAAGLPAGWSLDARSGALSATAPAAAVVSFTATVTDDAGGATAAAQSACSIRIAAPIVATCPTLTGQAGVSYSSTVSAAGGIAPYSYSLASGSLPAGLSMTAAGALAGTPSAAGSFPLTFRVADSTGQAATVACTLAVAPAVPTVVCPATLAQVSVAYSSGLVGSGGAPPYRYLLASGSLPAGLSLDAATGSISGVPTTLSAASFVARVVDSRGTPAGTGTTSCAIQTSPAPLTLAAPNATATEDAPYTSAFVAAGGVAPYTYSIVTGALPAGLTLNPSTGAVTGTPTTAKTYSFTAKVTDSTQKTATISAQIVVGARHNTCTLGFGYWKNHESAWPAATLTLGAQTYTKAELSSLLDAPVKGDASIELAHQLIAAKLNILNGANPSRAGASAIDQADSLLKAYRGKLPYGVKPGGAMTSIASVLEDFNDDDDDNDRCGCTIRK